MPYWHYQLVLSWYLHQPESHHQLSFKKLSQSVTDIRTQKSKHVKLKLPKHWKIHTCQIKVTKNNTFTMFFLCEIILFSGLMDREKDQKMGADVNTTPQPCNGPLIYVFPHSPHSVKFVLSFHWAHARIAPNSGQLMQGIQITEKIKIKCNKKEVEFPRTFLSFPHCFFGWVNNPKKIVHYPTRYYSTTRLLSSLPSTQS